MSKLFIASALTFYAAACVGAAGVGSAIVRDVKRQAQEPRWSLVMTVRNGDRFDDYVTDHGLTLGDCQDELRLVRGTFADAANGRAVSFACERN